jgi:hypothetical protein
MLPRLSPHASRNGVAFDVTATAQQVVTALNGGTLITALPAMPDEAVSAVSMVHVRSQQASHHRRERAGIVELQKQMKMICYQAIMEHPNVESLAIACDQAQEHEMVVVVAENGVPVMAAVHDVVTRLIGPLQTSG